MIADAFCNRFGGECLTYALEKRLCAGQALRCRAIETVLTMTVIRTVGHEHRENCQ
jgi:hypothetical protein